MLRIHLNFPHTFLQISQKSFEGSSEPLERVGSAILTLAEITILLKVFQNKQRGTINHWGTDQHIWEYRTGVFATGPPFILVHLVHLYIKIIQRGNYFWSSENPRWPLSWREFIHPWLTTPSKFTPSKTPSKKRCQNWRPQANKTLKSTSPSNWGEDFSPKSRGSDLGILQDAGRQKMLAQDATRQKCGLDAR